MKKIIVVLLTVLMVLGLAGCSAKQSDDIYVVFTNDVHCEINHNINKEEDKHNIGYAGLSAYVKELKNEHSYVSLVDIGDFVQGGEIGSLTKGESIIKIMNSVGYDIVTVGNHEFDYGAEQLNKLFNDANFEITACNVMFTGKEANALEKAKPYIIKEYGKTKVAFIGVITPESITKSTPKYFMENDEYVYDFYGGNDGNNLYNKVQETVNEVRKKVDYVVVLSHLGSNELSAPFRSYDLIANTNGIDVVLDGHSHSTIISETVKNNKDEDVLLSSTGTGLTNVGLLVLNKDHTISTVLTSDYDKVDEEIVKSIEEVNEEFNVLLSEVIGNSEYDLSIYDPDVTLTNGNKVRLVRSREVALANLVADAYLNLYDADVAIINGGGVRADLPKGDVTFGSVYKTTPFQNQTALCIASGSQILDALEFGAKNTLAYTNDGENSVGENGGFMQVANIKYTIDTSVESSVEIDDNNMFVSVNGDRRVKDVLVYSKDTKEYEPLDPNKEYRLAGLTYTLANSGDGFTMFKNCEFEVLEGMTDLNAVIKYIQEDLNGVIDERYSKPEGRITVK